MALTPVDICNQALALVGQKETIASLSENATPAIVCSVLYEDTRDEALADAPWPFARRRALLGLLTETRTGWKNAYQLPGDCVAPLYVHNGVRPGAPFSGYTSVPAGQLPAGFAELPPLIGGAATPIPFSIEASVDGNSQVLLTDQDSAELVYTARITSVVAFPTLFRKALTQLLASKLGPGLAGKAAVGDYWARQYEGTKLKALAAAFRSEREDPEADAAHIAARG